MPSIVPSLDELVTPPTTAVRRRDLSNAPFRHPPEPRYSPLEFYNAVSRSDPEQLAKIVFTDAYFITQDNGAGAPLHFAATHARLDMVHHLLNMGAPVNQRDDRGCTALHRAAYLAQHPGYLEVYELLLSRGANPSILSENYDPYLAPGCKRPVDLQPDPAARAAILALEERYERVPKAQPPHPSIGDWWTLYDYGLTEVLRWATDQHVDFPGVRRRPHAQSPASALSTEDVLRSLHATRAAKDRALRATRRAALFAGKQLTPLRTPVALLFPGQGSQAVGMLKASLHLPAVKSMVATASTVLGYDLEALCLEGPADRLDATEFSQPALLVADLAAVELLRSTHPEVIQRVSAVAGLSLGEYAALCHAGVLRFEDALRLVEVRGKAMAAAARDGKHGMLSVVGLSDSVLLALCEEVKRGQGGVCEVANRLFPQGRVVSGDEELLNWLEAEALKRGALKTRRLKVSGAFHTQRMASARVALEAALNDVEVQAPRITVYSNVTGKPLEVDDVRVLLARQVVEPVQWERTLRALLHEGKRELYETGPGKQIKSMLRRIDEDLEVVNVQP